MILVIGERVNDRKTNPEGWRKVWEKHGWNAALRTPAMTRGGSLKRLQAFMPDDKLIVNLLPPDNRPGTWDQPFANRMAVACVEWLIGEPEYTGVVLLGRRVLNTFTNLYTEHLVGAPKQYAFGDTLTLAGRPCVGLPHPSGRSRYWNDPEALERVRAYVVEVINASPEVDSDGV